jgi:hypothetical protein
MLNMNKIFKKGWGYKSISSLYLENLINLKESLVIKYKKNLNYENNNLEIYKSVLRSMIRFDKNSKYLAKEISKILISDDDKFKEYYLTRPYVMFHVPSDLNEQGNFHNDNVFRSGEMHTIWIPLNKKNIPYKPLSIINYTQNFFFTYVHLILSKLFKQKIDIFYEKFLKLWIIDILIKKNTFYFWKSSLFHRGNFNSSKDFFHAALVFRVSKKPFCYEPCMKLFDLVKRKFFFDEKISDQILLNNLLEIKKNRTYKTSEVSKKNHLNKNLSFALSILSQRANAAEIADFDLISYKLSKENLITFERLLRRMKDKKSIREFIEMIDSYQEEIILKKMKIEFSKKNLNVLSWR